MSVSKYREAAFKGYEDIKLIDEPDAEGMALMEAIGKLLCDVKIEYYSDAKCTKYYM